MRASNFVSLSNSTSNSGADGKSAYQIATANGFIGTEVQWLASLKGADGTIGVNGATGPQGPQGIQGVKGDTGLQGPQGVKGDTGTAGTNGYTPVKGVDYFDGVTGPAGPKGDTGLQGIQGPAGTNGTNGSQGIQGIQGPAGTNGTNGVDGVAAVSRVAMTSTQASTSVTLANVTQLTLPIVANGVYQIECFVTFQSAATTTGANIGLITPSGCLNMVEIVVPIVSTAVASALRTTFPNATTATNLGNVLGTGVTAINSNHTARISGIIKNGATAGSCQIQFATEVAASAITLQIGSELQLIRIA